MHAFMPHMRICTKISGGAVRSLFKLMAVGLSAGILAALLVIFAIARGWIAIPGPSAPVTRLAGSATPGTDIVDRYRCRSGLTKRVVLRGVEDGFSRQGSEVTVQRDALLKMEYFADIYNQSNTIQRARNFDEIGVDKVLIDRFPIPLKIVSGVMVLRTQPEDGSENDYVVLGDIEQDGSTPQPDRTSEFVATLAKQQRDEQGLVVIGFNKFEPNPHNEFAGKLIDYLNTADRNEEIDFLVQDDTAIDFAALILCQAPVEARGTTLREARSHPFGADISFLSCGQDRTQAQCNPLSGDMICEGAIPLACYHSGSGLPPKSVHSADGDLGRYFADGEVRLTPAVAGNRFASLSEANRYCAAQFGSGWRVLSYHEGGGGNVISRSAIAPLSRAWVDIRDQRYGNCWDREKAR